MKTPTKQPEKLTTASDIDETHWLIGGIFFAYLVLSLVLFGLIKNGTQFGPIGDWFGGILNPLIAAIALVGVWRSVKIQRESLKITKEGVESQIRTQRRQLSQQTFFDLLSLRAQAVQALTWPSDQSEQQHGQFAIKAILRLLETSVLSMQEHAKKRRDTDPFRHRYPEAGDIDLEPEAKIDPQWGTPQDLSQTERLYLAAFITLYTGEPTSSTIQSVLRESLKSPLETELGHIFRATYQVLKFLYQCDDFDSQRKKDLSNYLRAQMSEGEFALFALTALTSIGKRSRAVSIAFDFYEDRLHSIPWAKSFAKLFDPKLPHNKDFAIGLGFPILERTGQHAD